MRSRPTQAIVLAAGSGRRIRGLFPDRPKPLIEIDGHTLISRSLALLRGCGIARIVVVVGYRAEDFSGLDREAGVELVPNPRHATHGSMGSLEVGLARCDADLLVLEGDLVYEERALTTLLASRHPDAVLASGPTGAGDEVWVGCEGDALRSLSKQRAAGEEIAGEFVGITRVSRELATALPGIRAQLCAERGSSEIEYDSHALARAAQTHSIRVELVPDLEWGEIDDRGQYERVRDRVWPACLARDRGAPVADGASVEPARNGRR